MTEIKIEFKVLCDDCGIDHQVMGITYQDGDFEREGFLCVDCLNNPKDE